MVLAYLAVDVIDALTDHPPAKKAFSNIVRVLKESQARGERLCATEYLHLNSTLKDVRKIVPGENFVLGDCHDKSIKTGLEGKLGDSDAIVVMGFSVYCCVYATVNTALDRGYNVITAMDVLTGGKYDTWPPESYSGDRSHLYFYRDRTLMLPDAGSLIDYVKSGRAERLKRDGREYALDECASLVRDIKADDYFSLKESLPPRALKTIIAELSRNQCCGKCGLALLRRKGGYLHPKDCKHRQEEVIGLAVAQVVIDVDSVFSPSDGFLPAIIRVLEEGRRQKHTLFCTEFIDPDTTSKAVRRHVLPSDFVVGKEYDKFEGTGLQKKLKDRDAQAVVMMGYDACYCVYETARHAVRLGYPVLVADETLFTDRFVCWNETLYSKDRFPAWPCSSAEKFKNFYDDNCIRFGPACDLTAYLRSGRAERLKRDSRAYTLEDAVRMVSCAKACSMDELKERVPLTAYGKVARHLRSFRNQCGHCGIGLLQSAGAYVQPEECRWRKDHYAGEDH